MKKLGFWAGNLHLRGVQVSVYDYAHYWEELCNGESYIFALKGGVMDAFPKFKSRFGDRLFFCDNPTHLTQLLTQLEIDTIYFQKSGGRDKWVCPGKTNLIHVVFQNNDPHGDVYTYISPWLARTQSPSPQNFVPLIVNLPSVKEDLRKELNIPLKATVFGRHGGFDSFNIKYVSQAIYEFALNNPDNYFLFLNTSHFCPPIPNIIHLPGTWNMEYKTKFINTCDAMIHARDVGESFGLALAEFLHQGKPVISCKNFRDKNHVDTLGDLGIWYDNKTSFIEILNTFNPPLTPSLYMNLVSSFSPKKVMERFTNVFKLKN